MIDVVILARWFKASLGRYLMSAVISEPVKGDTVTDLGTNLDNKVSE